MAAETSWHRYGTITSLSHYVYLQLSAKAQELTLESDRYQVTYHRFGVNIRESSITTLDHYFALRALHTTIRGNVTERYDDVLQISEVSTLRWDRKCVCHQLKHTHTHTRLTDGPLSGTTRVSRYQ